MPKISDEKKQAKRGEILEAARRCFARYGYEGATVARLEEETGVSRGAIFNYFPNKQALFVELAIDSSERLTQLWLEEGFRALMDAIVHEDPDWLAVQLEATRRIRTDSEFRRLLEERERAIDQRREERFDALRPNVRDDVSIETVAIFLSLVANGLALRQSMGDKRPDLEELAELVETGVRRRRKR